MATLRRLNAAALLPYRVAWVGEIHVHEARFQTQAMFEPVISPDPLETGFEDEARQRQTVVARTKLEELIAADDAAARLNAGALRRLEFTVPLQQGRVIEGAYAVLGQSAVAAWGAFEAFVSDTVRAVLNQRPAALRLLLDDEAAKKRVSTRLRLSLVELLDTGLNLSERVGDLILSGNDLSDYTSIKAVLLPLLGNDDQLKQSLDHPSVRIHSKLRNILVHRAGIADERFEHESGGRWKAGVTVTITVADLADHIKATGLVVEKTVIALRRFYGLNPIPMAT